MSERWVRKSGRSLERLRNSANGNPRFRVTFDDGTSFETGRDAQVGYLIGNSEFDGVVDILVRRREIVDIRAVPGYECKRCGGPSPAGVGYVVYGGAGVTRNVSACKCGHSVRPA